jgi:hypothetical protein
MLRALLLPLLLGCWMVLAAMMLPVMLMAQAHDVVHVKNTKTQMQCRAGGQVFNPLVGMETAAQVRVLNRQALPMLEAWVRKGTKCQEAAEGRTVFLMRWVSAHPDLIVKVDELPDELSNDRLLVPYLLSSAWVQHRAVEGQAAGNPMTLREMEDATFLGLARMIRRGTVAGVEARDAVGDWPWVKCRTKNCLQKNR